ncbi:MAG: hypothetical protein ABJN42_10000 [Roseibium sp.]|uniref:hypothetical protein n=1 Tax=Roseibium sp. TaxID=1936156 RepID=UPI003297BF6B
MTKHQPDLLEEFFYRKSDGIGLSDRYPETAAALTKVMDVLPKGLTDFDETTVARVAGWLTEKGLSAADTVSSILSGGPGKFMAEQARDRIVEAEYGKPASIAVKEVMSPGKNIIDEVKKRMIVVIGVTVSMSVHELMKSAAEAGLEKDARWHAKYGIDMREGSDLHKDVGGPARPALVKPTKMTREESMAHHNPFLDQSVLDNWRALNTPPVDYRKKSDPDDTPEI